MELPLPVVADGQAATSAAVRPTPPRYSRLRLLSSEENSFMPDAQAVIEKTRALSPERLGQVEDFVDFLAGKTRRQAAMDRLLAIAPALEAAGVPPLTENAIQAEVEAVRAARRARGSMNDGSCSQDVAGSRSEQP
jgi:hypothetical protein